MNNRRPREEEKKEPSALAQGNFGGDFNLSGTQIGGGTGASSTTASTRMNENSSGAGRVNNGRIVRRPHSLNHRLGAKPEEERKLAAGNS